MIATMQGQGVKLLLSCALSMNYTTPELTQLPGQVWYQFLSVGIHAQGTILHTVGLVVLFRCLTSNASIHL